MKKERFRKFGVGDRFGRLIISESYVEKKGEKWAHKVTCDCGTSKIVRGVSLSSGQTTSCGCYQIEVSRTHGMCGSPEYVAWQAMITRVKNKNQQGYKNYGGRGIDVCKEWESFGCFFKDMGKKPSKNHSIDRIDNNLGYGPKNCRWATRSCQSINQRIRIDNKTGVKGVYYRKDVKKYYASIQRNKKRINLGVFKTLEAAKDAIKNEKLKTGD